MEEPMRGADPVAGGLEVGYDETFEARWRHVQNIGLLVFAVFLVACVAGLLGRGPFSHHTAGARNGLFSVDYEPVVRASTSTLLTFHLSNGSDSTVTRTIFVSGRIVEPLGLQPSWPPQISGSIGAAGLFLNVSIAPHQNNALFRVAAMPSAPGPVPMTASLLDPAGVQALPDAEVHWTQVILP